MSFVCYICESSFTRNNDLKKHITLLRCQANFDDWKEYNNAFKELREFKYCKDSKDCNENKNKSKKSVINNMNNENVNIINNERVINNINTVNIKIEINPITKLQIKHIDTEVLKTMIYKYDDMTTKTPQKLNKLLSEYIKNIIYDKEHPENHAIKYTKTRPPTYNCKVQDINGNTINVIKGLNDTCDLLTDPILTSLKKKMKVFLNKYERDDCDDFDYGLYDTAIEQLRKEFNNENVKMALSSVLKNDILNDIEMKFKISIE